MKRIAYTCNSARHCVMRALAPAFGLSRRLGNSRMTAVALVGLTAAVVATLAQAAGHGPPWGGPPWG